MRTLRCRDALALTASLLSLYIVHDLSPRAMSKKVQGFVSAQSWFLDLTLVSMQ
jgi:hypothetical protein